MQENELSPSLTDEEKEIIMALRSTPISELPKGEVAEVILDLISDALVILNQTKLIDTEKTCDMIISDLYEKFKYFTVEELKKIFWLGSRGQLKKRPEDVVYVSVKIIFEWFVTYKTVIRHNVIVKQHEYDLKKGGSIESENVEERRRYWEEKTLEDIKNAYSKFLQTDIVDDPTGAIYIYLNNRGFIKISKEIKRKIYLEELEKCINLFFNEQGKIKGRDRWEINNNRRIVEKYRKQDTEIERLTDPEFKKLVMLTCQEKALRMTFEAIKELEMTMEEFLNE